MSIEAELSNKIPTELMIETTQNENKEKKDEKENNNDKKIEENKKINKNSNYYKLLNSPFSQQKIPSYRPNISNTTTGSIMFLLSITIIGLGIIIIFFSSMIEEEKIKYEKEQNNVTLNLNIKNSNTYFFYYEIENYYQNHKRYLKGVSENQLKGFNMQKNELLNDCRNALTNKEMNVTNSIDPLIKLNPNEISIPCGIYAKSYINLSSLNIYLKQKNETKILNLIEKDITWKSDREIKFNNNKNYQKQWVNMTNEHFIVWMKPSGYSTFRKLYGYINLDIGEYEIIVKCNNCNLIDHIVVSNVNFLGGKNISLGIVYIILGSFLLFFSVIILFKHENNNGNVVLSNVNLF